MSNHGETARLLARVPLFSGLTPDELDQVADVAVPRSWSRGHVIFRDGDSGDTCYVLRTGSVRVTRRHPGGRTVALAQLRPGQMFGELAMWGGETRSATIEALEDTTAVALLSSDMRRLVSRHPDLAVKMLEGLAGRLRRANERIAGQSFQTVAGRVASALLGQVQALQAEGAADRDVLVRSTQAELADLAGSSRESASRFLASLEREGLVTLSRGKVLVHEPNALQNYIY